ncbi:MAG: HAMP domain-containing histidine kinase [Bacteroidales bacterium]|nr:HAMP domain-containing histidine kinase [Bacteroidales bacterium]
MGFRFFIWISGTALVILILVQYYFITETFKTKQQQFDSKYSSLAKLGLFEFENKYYDSFQDSVYNYMDDFAYQVIEEIDNNPTRFNEDSITKTIRKEFRLQLNRNSQKNEFISSYLKNAGETNEFKTTNVIREIRLLRLGEEQLIYMDSLKLVPHNFINGYFLNNYTIERNFFRINYDYYISFPQRSKRISKEMTMTIFLAFVTLMIVFGVFFLTLRNLLIQKKLSELKTDFINNMTHELKTPLSTIAVASSSLAQNKVQLNKERIIELSGIIKKQNRHLTRLIDKILDISIWEKDQVKIERTRINLNAYFNDLLQEFKNTYPDISLEMSLQHLDPESSFSIDEVHMNTVINNLLSNAVKYGGDPPHIGLTVFFNKLLIIRVADNGKGIRDEERRLVFDKFFRGKDAKKKATKGLGLGLFYVKQIVEAHGGRVYLERSDENGSVFSIEIPT